MAASLDPMVTINSYGIMESVSDSVERVFGWSPDELIGKNIKILMPEPHFSRHDQYLEKYRETRETSLIGVPRELEAVRKDGTVFPCEVSIARVDLPGGGDQLFTGIIRDITERKKAEKDLQNRNEDLIDARNFLQNP